MSQVVSYQVPAHPSGLDMRTQVNAIVLAILGDNAGPSEPTEMYPGMMWGDTTANKLKRRTNANDTWVVIGPLDDFLGDVKTQIGTATATKVSKTGDTMTGQLTMRGANVRFALADDTALSYLMSDTSHSLGFANSAGNLWNFWVEDTGFGHFRQGIASLAAQGGLIQNAGSTFPNADPAAVAAGCIINWNESGGNGETDFVNNSGGGPGGFTFRSVNQNNTVQHFAVTIDGNGGVHAGSNLYAAGATYGTDGNVNGSIWGGWLSGFINTQIGTRVGKTTSNDIKIGWQLTATDCVDVNVDNAWNRHFILSQDNRWYSSCQYNSSGFIAINIDGSYPSGNRSIVTQASDGRLKNIHGETRVDALGAILHIAIIRYSFKEGEPEHNDGQVHECGFDAQQVQSVAPSMVYEVGDAKICHVYPNAGLAYCFRAIQQLFAMLTDLKNEIAALKAGKT